MLSLIFPSYKGADALSISLPAIRRYLSEAGIDYEVIVVDDGSNDSGKTKQVAEENNCTFIGQKRNMGKGAAVRKGFEQASGDIIMFTDADLPFGERSVTDFYHQLRSSDAELLIGDRTHPDSDYFAKVPASRRKASRVFSSFIRWFILSGRFDTQCGLKAFKKEPGKYIFKQITVDGFAFDVELLVIARKKGYTISRAPVRFLSSQESTSAGMLKHSFRMLWDLIRIKVRAIMGKYN